jgi:hypothetical protein
VRRNVIIITESVVQVQRVIYSLYSWGYTGMSVSDFDERVRVVSAQRLDPKIVSQVAEEYKTWTVDNEKADGTWYTALPLVVFDTANAVFDLENENDNAEVGRAMAYIKQSFAAFPIIIVSHTADEVDGHVVTLALGEILLHLNDGVGACTHHRREGVLLEVFAGILVIPLCRIHP